MILENSPWKYNEYDLMWFVDDAVEKRNDELLKLFKENKEEFEKKFRGIIIGVWQQKGAYGRNTREDMDRIIRGHRDFFLLKNDLKD